jgi:RNA polymerase sigma factor (sigma-70 family)
MSDDLLPNDEDHALIGALPEGVIAERIERCMALARSIAGRITARFRILDYGVEYDDVLSGALFGAWKAAVRFDATRGASLTTHAFQWIERYAILAARVDAGLTTRGDGVRTEVMPTESFGAADQESDGILLVDPHALDAEQITDAVVARRAVAELPEQERQVVYLTYWRDLGPTEAGRQIGVTRKLSRKILDRAHADMRASLMGATA